MNKWRRAFGHHVTLAGQMQSGFLERFAAKHVVPAFRERFLHEALKKQNKLQSRICHTIRDVFSDNYRGGACPFAPDDICIPITGTGIDSFREYRWFEVAQLATPGFGLLVASPDGSKFYAETEHGLRCPSIPYSSARTPA